MRSHGQNQHERGDGHFGLDGAGRQRRGIAENEKQWKCAASGARDIPERRI